MVVELRHFFPSEMGRSHMVCVICSSFHSLHNDCLHIEDVHLLFCAHFMVFYVQRISESRSSSGSTPSVRLTATILGCLVCVICNSNIYSNFA